MIADYPHAPGWRATAPETSEKAARQVAPKARRLVDRVYDAICEKPGAVHELARRLAPEGSDALALDRFERNVQPRVSELRALGKVEDSGERRDNQLGNPTVVWRKATPKPTGPLIQPTML